MAFNCLNFEGLLLWISPHTICRYECILGSTTSAVLQCTTWQICCSKGKQNSFPQMDSTLPRPGLTFSRLRCLFLDNTKAQKSICAERLNTHILSWHLESVGEKGAADRTAVVENLKLESVNTASHHIDWSSSESSLSLVFIECYWFIDL